MEIKPFWVSDNDETQTTTASMADDIGVDFSFFSTDAAKNIAATPAQEDTAKKKRSNKPKVAVDGQVMADRELANPIPGADIAEVNYARTYEETNNLLRGSIMQADALSAGVQEDLDTVRASKTLKSKYTYITNLTSAAASLLGTKASLIREMNSTITQIHNLELNRMKALKLDKSAENDDMRMMDIYSAFINTPLGTYTPNTPNIQDLTIGVNNPNSNIVPIEMTAQGNNSNLSPEQVRMRMEGNPNIQVVVRYDQSTGQRYFDVIDKNTGASIPNYPRPDAFLLEDTTIDVHSGIARNRNINAVWPLVLDGSNAMNIKEY